MKEDNQFNNKLIEEIRSLPEPNYDKEFDSKTQDKIHEKIMEFSTTYDKKRKKRFEMNGFYAGIVGVATLLLFSFIFLPNILEEKDLSQSNAPIPSFDLYEGRPLSIAVIGSPPSINEKQVEFFEITFEDLIQGDLSFYDAVFVMEEKLSEASNAKYAHIFLNLYIPTFYISANSHIPFIVEDIEYSESWKWTPGKAYAFGRIQSWNNPDSIIAWGHGLYNDIKTEETIKDVYSRIFQTIEEVDDTHLTIWGKPFEDDNFKVINQIEDEHVIQRINGLLSNAKWYNNQGSMATEPDYRIYHFSIWITPYRNALEIKNRDNDMFTRLSGEEAKELYKLMTGTELISIEP